MPHTFNPLDHPIVFQKPHRLTDVTCWHWHIPFAFALVSLQKPSVLVELGTHKGDSYCAFCQAVRADNLATTCFAVDCWEGDAHAGYYGGEVYEELKLYHDQHYGSFSNLVKSYFDDARGYFQDGSIDLLHIDGHHSYESVRHDFDAWLPKMSPRGVVLLHDTNVRERAFGVWRLWDELQARYPHYGFAYGSGLGVLLVGAEPVPATQGFIDALNADSHLGGVFFHCLGYAVYRDSEARLMLEKLQHQRRVGEEVGAELRRKEQKLRDADEWLKAAHAELETRSHLLDEKSKSLEQAYAIVKKKEQALAELRVRMAAQEKTLQEIYHSRGWAWLTRFRRIKQRVSLIKKKTPVKRVPFRTDDKTYHVRMRHPVRRDRPRVVHAIGNILTGGSSRLVVDLIEHLGHKYRQEVISCQIPNPLAYDGFPFHDFSEPITPDTIAGFLKDYRPDILHFHYWDEPWYRKVVAACEQYDCLVIENVNTPVAPIRHPAIDHYVFVSRYALHYTPEPPQNASVIYPGSNFNLFQRNGAPIPDDTIGMVYRLDYDKLKEDAIQVFIEVLRRRPRTRALIVGGGCYFDAYRRQVAEAGLTERFTFTGFVPYETLPGHYARMSLFVAPVYKESFGQVSPFAMRMQLPVAGYDVGALSEILGGTECLGKDPAALADIIIDLLDDRDKRLVIGERNAERAARLFAVETMIARYDDLYERLLKTRSAG